MIALKSKPVGSVPAPVTLKVSVDERVGGSYPTKEPLEKSGYRALRSLLREHRDPRRVESAREPRPSGSVRRRRVRTKSVFRTSRSKRAPPASPQSPMARILAVPTDDSVKVGNVIAAVAEVVPMYSSMRNFEYVEHLGRGVYGQVAKFVDKSTNEFVAIKAMDLEAYQTEGMKKCLVGELAILLTVNSPHLVKARGWYASLKHVFIVMDLAETDLRKDMWTNGVARLTERYLAHLCRGILTGLNELHGNGIFHSDIKEANVLLNQDGSAVLADYGLCRRLGATGRIDIGHREQFSPDVHRTPEELNNEGISMKKDLWVLGVMVYRLFTASNPFGNVATPSEVEMVKTCHLRFPEEIVPSQEFRDFLSGLLCPEADRMEISLLLEHAFIVSNLQ